MTPARQFRRHFTVAEANAWIPRLAALFDSVQQALTDLDADSGLLEQQAESRGGNGGGIDARGYLSTLAHVEEALQELRSEGIVLQDVRRGLVDFPHILKDGSEVLLCWESSDGDHIGWYHEVTAGYAGRRPLGC